jgi:hypothetical protein
VSNYDTIGYAKGGDANLLAESFTVADFHALAVAGQTVVNAMPGTFAPSAS